MSTTVQSIKILKTNNARDKIKTYQGTDFVDISIAICTDFIRLSLI